MFVVKRSTENPILSPSPDRYWEAAATFNLCPVKRRRKIFGCYRALSKADRLTTPEQLSTIGIGESIDGIHFENRRQFITPAYDWDKFGCEDPRVTLFEGKYYIFYTALSTYPFGPEGIKVAAAVSPDMESITERHLVTPFNAKAMALFPERVDGKVTAILSVNTDRPPEPARIAIAQAPDIEDFWSPDFWRDWYDHLDEHTIDLRRSEYDQVEVGAPPIRVKGGWLLIYSHIQNYFSNPSGFDKVFGVEALILDEFDLKKIVGRTKGPILSPELPYELAGFVPNIVFPTGVLQDGKNLRLYYGAADTVSGTATLDLSDLLFSIHPGAAERWHFKRTKVNPILSPVPDHFWEAKAVFNPAAYDDGKRVHLLYRATAPDNTSTIGYAASDDGLTISERLPDPIYVPRADFEAKKVPDGNSGCEDPRLTLIDDRLYMFYTAFSGLGPPRVAVSTILAADLTAKRFDWSEPVVITPPDIDDKDACLLPETFDGKYFFIHRIGTDVCGDFLDSLDFATEKIDRCHFMFGPRPGAWDSGKVGITAPPLKTSAGWLLLYHGSSRNHHTYRIGAILLDLNDPTTILARSADPIFEPVEQWEKEGVVPNVVFPCGLTLRHGLIYIYYGGADTVVGTAVMELEVILDALSREL